MPAEPELASSDRRWVLGLGAGALVAIAALLVVLGIGGDDEGAAPSGAATSTTRDLSTVTADEMERIVAEHPGVVPMRLALVERYLRESNFEAAQAHAEAAAVRAELAGDRSRALAYLGLSTAVLGDPDQGEDLIVQSLALDPSNRDALYYLGRVRFEFLGRPDLAAEPLERLLTFDMDDEQRQLVEALLDDVRLAAATATTAPPVPSG